MAETKYTFSVLEDFLNQIVNSDKLTNEILNSSIETNLLFINVQNDICDIWFDSELNGPDHETLNYIISIHNGEPYDEFVCKGLDSESDSSTSSRTYVNRNSLYIYNAKPGTYKIQWYFEFFLDYYRYGGKVRIQMDDEITLGEVHLTNILRDKPWDSRCGFSFVNFFNEKHIIDLDYATMNSRYPLVIKNIKIYVHKIDTLIETKYKELNPFIIKESKIKDI